ncbi:dihydrodipicolinate synthase family protein [Litoribrevibacter albus]|uniref:Dihydrodipicolinate synthase family protein n=1 Tax=Litoribrevibacter albus TaxID=1473156 RepID=A0AA37S9X2_9GAMM|nr:dihydrodipicolinate synthase family protein [Litoribrevibacter albus]GLQ30995.1 dihydrodipicolinate synthase family protein [Litoribrevibacter albus]
MSNKSILIPLVTPLNVQKKVCEFSVKALIERTKSYTEGYIPCLTSGEGWKLSEEDWCDMVAYTRKYAPTHRIVAGIEKPTTEEVLRFAQLGAELGIDGIIITSPFDEAISQEDIYQHYRKVHDQLSIDIYIYNESELSLNTTQPETLVRISELPRVVGIKESSNSEEFNAIRAHLQSNGVKVYQGWEDKIVDDRFADGNICSLSNVYPQLCLQATQAPSDELKSQIGELCERHQIFAEDWYAHIKHFLNSTGVISSDYCFDPS